MTLPKSRLQPRLTPARTRAAIACLSRADRRLGALIRQWGPCGLVPNDERSPYEELVRSIVYQQLHGKAAGTILARLQALYPHGGAPRPEELLATSDDLLRAAGLSRAKTAALKDLAAHAIEGKVPSHGEAQLLPDDELVERLCAIRGVGRWTVEMMLMFKLGRPDVLPASDFGVRSGFALTYGLAELPSAKELLAHGERWKPYRSVAAWYLWRAVDLAKAKEKESAEAAPRRVTSRAKRG